MKLISGCLKVVFSVFAIIVIASILAYALLVDDGGTSNRLASTKQAEQSTKPTDTASEPSNQPSAKSEPETKRTSEPASEFAIDNWQGDSEADFIAFQYAMLKMEGKDLPQVDTQAGSIGMLGDFEVMSIADSDTVQVDLSSPSSFDLKVSFIFNVNTSDFVTGDRYSLNGPVKYVGVQTYQTVLGATQNAHSYRAIGTDVLAEADRLLGMMKAKQSVLNERAKKAERNRLERVSQRRSLIELIAGMRQNARTIANFDQPIRERVAEAVKLRLDKYGEQGSVWKGDAAEEFSSIIGELQQCNADYVEDGADPQAILDLLGLLMDRARALETGLAN